MNRAKRYELYKNDYQKDAQGQWQYIGQWYAATQRTAWRAYRWRYLTQIVLSVLLAASMSLMPAGAMIASRFAGFNYVILLYAPTLIFAVAAAWYAGKVMGDRLCLPLHEKGSADWHMILTVLAMVSAMALTAAQVIYLFTEANPADRQGDMLLLAAAAILSAVELHALCWQRKLNWQTLDNDAK